MAGQSELSRLSADVDRHAGARDDERRRLARLEAIAEIERERDQKEAIEAPQRATELLQIGPMLSRVADDTGAQQKFKGFGSSGRGKQ